MNSEHKRIDWVDTGKFFCIMLVMMSHLESGTEAIRLFYFPFFLPMFFFLSGYVYRQPESFRQHLGKKARGLLVPWLVFSVGNILLTLVTPFVDKSDVPRRLLMNFLQIRGLDDEVWFVTALFMCFLPFYFFARRDRLWLRLPAAWGLSLASLLYGWYGPVMPWGTRALPWHLQLVFPYMLWMLLGYWFRQYGEKWFDRLFGGWKGLILWGLYFAAVYGPWVENTLFQVIFWQYVRGGLGIACMVALSKAVKTNRYIRFVGANTLTYFALHGRVYALVELVLKKLAGGFYDWCLGSAPASNLLAAGITVIVSLVLVVPAEIINKWLPWMLGRRKAAEHGG